MHLNVSVQRVTGRSLEDWDQIYKNRRASARKEMEVSPGMPMLMSHMHEAMITYGLERSDFQLVWFVRNESVTEPEWVKQYNDELEEMLKTSRIDLDLYSQLRLRPETTQDLWIWKSVDTTHKGQMCLSIMGYRYRQDRFEKLFPKW